MSTELATRNENETGLAKVVAFATADHLRATPGAIHALQAAVIHEARRNPKLMDCAPDSMAAAAVTCAELGLYPSGSAGHIHFIPRGNQVTVQVGFRGLLELARRAGVHVDSRGVVYEDEVKAGHFSAMLAPFDIEHRFSLDDIDRSDGKLVAAYASCVVDGARVGVILTRNDLDNRRKRAMGGGAKGPWKTDYAAMCRKSAVRALLMSGTVPLTSQQTNALRDTDELPTIDVQPAPVATPPATDPTARAAAAIGDDGGEW